MRHLHGERLPARPTALGLILVAVLSLLLAACGNARTGPARAWSLAAVLRMRPEATSIKLLPGSPPHLASLHFVTAMDGWAGGQGVILATGDGGRTWHRQYLGQGTVTGFSFLSPAVGFAATSAGLLGTRDGKTWRLLSALPLAQVQFLSRSERLRYS